MTVKKAPTAPKAPAKKKAEVELEGVNSLKVKNEKGVEFEVSGAYYAANKHTLTIA